MSSDRTTDQRDERTDTFSKRWWRNVGVASWIAAKDLYRDNGPFWAAAISYYTIFSSIPLMLLMAQAGSLFLDSGEMVDQISGMVGDLLPTGEDRIQEIVESSRNSRAAAGLVSIVALLWSGTRIFGTLSRAMNVAYDVDDHYGRLRLFGIEVIMLLSVGVLMVMGLLGRFLVDAVWQIREIPEEERTILFRVLRGGLPFIVTAVAFFLIYRFVPRHRPSWKPAIVGAVMASAAFWLGRAVFLEYLNRAANYGEIYGPIALLIIIMLWVWIASMMLLMGGQLVSHYQEVLVEGTPPEEVEERHRDPGRSSKA